MLGVSRKSASISPSPTLAIDAKLKEMKAAGIDIVGFGTGEPDFDTPDYIKQAAIKAIQDGATKYTPASGTLELRQAICNKFRTDNGLRYTPANIVVSNGAKHSILNALQAICNPGDEIIIPAPYWVSYPELVKLADGTPIIVETAESQEFKLTLSQIERIVTNKTKGMIINSPSNPTGMMYTEKELSDIAKLAIEKDIYIISDEIYENILYDGNEHVSIASLSDQIQERTIIINGVSKSYAMTGWRIGYTASNLSIAKIMGNVQSHATSNPNSIAQKAAVAALQGPSESVLHMVEEFKRRRDYMLDRILNMKYVTCTKPKGTFYLFLNISEVIGKKLDGESIQSANDLATALLEKAKVAVVPGEGFGTDKYIRLSYATSMENIIEGLNRIESILTQLC